MRIAIVNLLGRFQDDNDQSPGIGLRLLRDREREIWTDRNQCRIEMIECDGPAKTTAREIVEWGAEFIAVAAYSHGVGQAYVEFSRELAARNRRTNLLLAIAPVIYRKFGIISAAFSKSADCFPLPPNTDSVIAARTLNRGWFDPYDRVCQSPGLIKQFVYGSTLLAPEGVAGPNVEYLCAPDVNHSTIDNRLEPQDLFIDRLQWMVEQ